MADNDFDSDALIRAIKILDLPSHGAFSEDDVKSKWKKIIERVHPDAGGTNFLAEEANNARDLLSRWIRAGRPSLIRTSSSQRDAESPNVELVAGAVVKAYGWAKSFVSWLVTVVITIIILTVAVRFYNENIKSSCKVLNVNTEGNVFFNNDDPDWGVTVTAVVKNTGSASNIRLLFNLTTSEGSYAREYKADFSQAEERRVKADFNEPTVQAKNIKSTVSCQPQ